MRELTVDKKRILNFSEKHVETVIANAKKAFRHACDEDKTLSKEYKDYVHDPNNVNVTFRPLYGRIIELSLNSVYADYSFDYEKVYYQTTGFTGDVKFDSYGDAHLSNVHSTGEHRSYTSHRNGSTHFASTALSRCEMILGAKDALKNQSFYVDVTCTSASSMPRELAALASEKVTNDTINKYISIGSLPKHVYEKMRKNALGSTTSSPINFKMTLTDYHIDELFITYLPYAYELDVWVNYDGKTYSLKGIKQENQITAQGPLSNHYEDYLACQEETKCKFEKNLDSKIAPFYLLSINAPFGAALSIVLMLVFCVHMKHEAFRYMYLWASISLALIGVVFSAVSAFIMCKKRPLSLSADLYAPQKQLSSLQNDMDNLAAKQTKSSVKAAKIWLCMMIAVTVGIGAGIRTVWLKTYNEHFWYTPEIIKVYQGAENGVQYMLEIVSCDENGKFEAIDQSVRNGMYAKARYEGQITSKNENELKATLTLKEEIYNPQKGNFQKSYILTFTNTYQQIRGYIYSDTGMRSDNAIFASSLEAHELEKTYLHYASNTVSILKISSCDADGRFSGTYFEANSEGFCEKDISGEILVKTNKNDVYLRILSSKDLKKSKKVPIDQSAPIYVSDNFEKLTFGDKTFTVASNHFEIISSAEEFKKLNSGSVAILIADIDLDGAELYPSKFTGSLIGNGHTIKNFKLKVERNAYSWDYVGLFRAIGKGSFIYDVKIENGTTEHSAEAEIHAGLLVACCHGSIFEVSASGQIDAPNGLNVGGVAGSCGGNVYNVTSTVDLVEKNNDKAIGNGQ